MSPTAVWLLCGALLYLSGHCTGLIERLYCGTSNCYEVLGLERDVTPTEIRKAYRKLAMQYHPDKNKAKGSREKFVLVSTAYDVLKDTEERTNYDYMLDHPEEVYGHYYRYYRHRTPKIDVRMVLISGILVISVMQYLGWWHSYNTAMNAAFRMPKYRLRAKELAVSRGLIAGEGNRKRRGGKTEEEAVIRSVLEENLNVIGGYGKPRLQDVLLFRLVLAPYSLMLYLRWYTKWVWHFNIKREAYGPEERAYLTQRSLKLSVSRWEALENSQKEELVSKQLWVKENLVRWKQEMQEDQKAKMADSNKYKMYRRYMKSQGKSGVLDMADMAL